MLARAGRSQTYAGGSGADSLAGLGGKDTLSGMGGDDVLDGGADNDVLHGHQRILSADIFRGRYWRVPAGKPVRYRFELPPVNHVLKPGYRLMVQVQSSWFPLYDRNPQTFVPDIFFAQAGDYRAATHTLLHSPASPTSITLNTAPAP